MSVILQVENIAKQYRLGTVGTGTLSHDLNRWWHKIRGKQDPYLKIGEVNDRSAKTSEDYVWALRDINFEVAQGEVLGIIGKNGAGKSTLLKILSRVTAPTTGRIRTRGRIASLLEVGTGFHAELTGRENIFMNGAVLGMSKWEIKRKLDEIIAFSDCEKYIDTPVKRYSSGMKVRLGFAVAAHLEPEILVVDEVLAVGDAEFQKKAIGKIQDLSVGENRTVLFVSHNMASVRNLCTRGIVLENGCIGFVGTADEAVGKYLKSNKISNLNETLQKNKNRIGSGKVRVQAIELYDKDYQPVQEIISGDTLIVKITINKFKRIDYSKLIVAVNIQNSYKDFILSFVSDEMGQNFETLSTQNNFYLKIPSIYLRGGPYYFRVLLSENNTEAHSFLDLVDHAFQLNVLPGDLWNTGKINRKASEAIIPAIFVFNE